MSEMHLVPLDHPLMLAMWATATKYSQAGRDVPNDEISNHQREEHAKGSLWAAFEAGFNAALKGGTA